jgi:hypothetical protein
VLRRLTRKGWPAAFPIVQFPNGPLAVALIASLAGRLTHGREHAYAAAIFYVALTIWAYDEARRGDNWFRRLLGVVFLAYIVVELARKLEA